MTTKVKPTVEKWEDKEVRYGYTAKEWFDAGEKSFIRHLLQEAKAEERENERERILEAIQPAVNDFMAGANTLAKNKMVDSAREVRENIQYIVYVIRDDKKGLSTLNTKASLKQEGGK